MRLWKSWIIAKKDMTMMVRRRAPLAILIGLPVGMGAALPVIIESVIRRKGFSAAVDSNLISAFGFFFVIFAALVPLYISSYSIIGEKVEKSLEPLLSTPTTDGEILMGKYIGTFIPAVFSIYLGTAVYMSLMDAFTRNSFGYLFFPNWGFTILLVTAVPLASTYAITLSVFISSKFSNVMSAYQSGGLTLVPFLALYVLGEIGLVNLEDTTNVLFISSFLLLVTILMYFISRATFGREKILTEWK